MVEVCTEASFAWSVDCHCEWWFVLHRRDGSSGDCVTRGGFSQMEVTVRLNPSPAAWGRKREPPASVDGYYVGIAPTRTSADLLHFCWPVSTRTTEGDMACSVLTLWKFWCYGWFCGPMIVGDSGWKNEAALYGPIRGIGLPLFSSYSDIMLDLSIGAYGSSNLYPLSDL